VSIDHVASLNEREWVNDMAVGAINGMIGGAVLAMLVADTDVGLAVWSGGLIGLVMGLLGSPIKWLLDRRPPGPPDRRSPPKGEGS
jgi:hypothetical protein